MSTLPDKVAYVRAAGQERPHRCHWPGCERQVPPAKWGCRQHWNLLPARIRARIWRTYRMGQERDGTPSREYLAAAREAREWILQLGGGDGRWADRQLNLFSSHTEDRS